MQTAVRSISDTEAVDRALDLLLAGDVIVAPTDTVYGIMCRYDSQNAVQRLYRIKQRPRFKAIAILIGDRAQLPLVVQTPIPPLAQTLAARFWPGALTLVVPARSSLPPALTAGGTTVGVRMPDHPALCELMRHAGPLAATSANRSGEKEAYTAQRALEQLDGLVPLVLCDDDGDGDGDDPSGSSPASTVVDLSGPEPRIVREGPVASGVLAVLGRSNHPPC